MRDYVRIAEELALQAGQLQIERLGNIERVEYKGAINIVTDVDRACEELIVSRLQVEFPSHDVLAEEGGGIRKNSDYRWLVDPLDGTVNYAHTYPLFGTAIALEFKNEIVVGVFYEPNRGELFVAEKGAGATMNGERIKVSSTNELDKSLLATGFGYNVREDVINNLDNFSRFIMEAQSIRRPGVASVDLAYVACGRLDGFWEIYLKPWDVAAGSLIVREAGGMVTSFSGAEFDVYGIEILASNGAVHNQMVEVLSHHGDSR